MARIIPHRLDGGLRNGFCQKSCINYIVITYKILAKVNEDRLYAPQHGGFTHLLSFLYRVGNTCPALP